MESNSDDALNVPSADYDVLAKWDSASFDAQTRDVLRHRLDNVPPRRFLSESEWELLDAIVHRLCRRPIARAPSRSRRGSTTC